MGAIRDRLRLLASTFRSSVVLDCPPELYACEVCGKIDCDHEEWANCKERLAAAEFMRSANRPHQTEASKPAK